MRHRMVGFSLFEWALVVFITGILITLFLNRILILLVDVERIELLQWEGKIRVALSHELSRRVIDRDFDKIGKMEGMNPIGLLQDRPRNYLGQEMNPRLDDLPSGAWVFDGSRKVLIYIINHPERFRSSLSGRPRTEYRVSLEYQDINHNGRFDFKPDSLQALKLVSAGQYQWLSDVD